MSIPIHNLYDFIHQVTEKQYWVRYFYPFGSKDINNIVDLQPESNNIDLSKTYANKLLPVEYIHRADHSRFQPMLLCHDQEPLDFQRHAYIAPNKNRELWEGEQEFGKHMNLRAFHPTAFQNKWILLHSELNSEQVDLYESTNRFSCAYCWSHAFFALDWFRFAKYDTRYLHNFTKKKFLIYNREQTGSRTYRKTFASQISDLDDYCQVGSFKEENISGNSSAVYTPYDYAHTDISVVLETVFDQRIHLTEKTIRPMACQHPFLLLAGPGSLQYLRNIGFKTFGDYINEDYDQESNNDTRLQMVVNEMKRLSKLDTRNIVNKLQSVIRHNHKFLFSEEFLQQITNELKQNVQYAKQKAGVPIDWKLLEQWRQFQQENYPEWKDDKWATKRRQYIDVCTAYLKQGGNIEDYVPPNLD